MGWAGEFPSKDAERVVDRLILEMLLVQNNRLVACTLDQALNHPQGTCFITWVPDPWSLIALWAELNNSKSKVDCVVYPGYGLSLGEVAELKTALHSFGEDVQLKTYEEVWP